MSPPVTGCAAPRRESTSEAILEALRDENMYDPRRRIEVAQDKAHYMPQLLRYPKSKRQSYKEREAESTRT